MLDAEVKSIDWCDEYSKGATFPAILALTASIGQKGEQGGTLFQVVVCNPAWISEKVSQNSALWPRGMLIVEAIETDHIKASLQSLIDQFQSSKDWAQFNARLNRYLLW